MARSNDVQYIRFYSYGSTAEKIEQPVTEKKKINLPKPRKIKVPAGLIKVDALALTGLIVAGVMLLCMAVGLVQVHKANVQLQQAQLLVAQLEAENDRLKTEYEHGVDLAEIRVSAEAMGLVPIDQVRHVTVRVPDPVVEEEITWWEQWIQDFKDLFA